MPKVAPAPDWKHRLGVLIGYPDWDPRAPQSVDELLPPPPAAHPRSARVNTLKMSVADALDWIQKPPAEHAKLAGLVCLRPPTCGHGTPLRVSGKCLDRRFTLFHPRLWLLRGL